MKPFPAHLGALSAEDFESRVHESKGARPAQDETHPLTAQLRRALARPGMTEIGTYAELVEKIMSELHLVKGANLSSYHGAQSAHSSRRFAPTKLTMSDEDADRIVECLTATRSGAGKAPN